MGTRSSEAPDPFHRERSINFASGTPGEGCGAVIDMSPGVVIGTPRVEVRKALSPNRPHVRSAVSAHRGHLPVLALQITEQVGLGHRRNRGRIPERLLRGGIRDPIIALF